jgi:preprotein translocase SecE subunit
VKQFWIQLGIGTFIFGGLFAFLWQQGYLARIATYVKETRDELRKCAWPSREELWQTTVLVALVFAGIGVFTVSIDLLVSTFVKSLL